MNSCFSPVFIKFLSGCFRSKTGDTQEVSAQRMELLGTYLSTETTRYFLLNFRNYTNASTGNFAQKTNLAHSQFWW